MKERTKYKFTAKDLAVVWSSSSDWGEVVRKISELEGKEVPRNVIASRVRYYRSIGAQFKEMPRSAKGRKVNIEELNAIGV